MTPLYLFLTAVLDENIAITKVEDDTATARKRSLAEGGAAKVSFEVQNVPTSMGDSMSTTLNNQDSVKAFTSALQQQGGAFAGVTVTGGWRGGSSSSL